MGCLWPIRTGQTFFDVWSVTHASFWLAVGVFFGLGGVPPQVGWPIIIVCAYLWEILERFVFGQYVSHREVWFNSFVSDPLMCVAAALGYVLARQPFDAFALGLLASWLVVGGNLEILKPSPRMCGACVTAVVLVLVLVRTFFWPAPWYEAWVLEPLTVTSTAAGAWLISKQ